MGFASWTLIGMGVTALGALIMVALAYAAQSPRFLLRVGLAGHRLDLRVKTFTGLALAFLLLMVGFFLAGVPLGPVDGETAAANLTPTTPAPTNPTQNGPGTGAMAAPDSGAMDDATMANTVVTTDLLTPDAETAANDSDANLTPASGAFGGPPATAVTVTATTATPSATPELAGPPVSDTAVESSSTPAAATPSPTPSATPTATPSPTITPTPIDEDTAVISTNGSTLWLRRSPGGQTLVIVRDQEVVIDRHGRANQGGILWHEIMTVAGVTGWVQEEFLDFSN